MTRLIIGSKEFERRKLAELRGAGESALIRRGLETEIRAAENAERAFDFVISTQSVDRYGDTIDQAGWKLEAYRKNPVVLWMHDNTLLPVARARNIRIEEGKLKATAVFTPESVEPFNDKVFALLGGGFLSATSVGFIPLKYNFVDDPSRRFGIDFLEQELIEFSIVTVPANAEALIEGRSAAECLDQTSDGASVELSRRRLDLLKLGA
jgi:HK97 family phage prohead protease